MLSTHWSVPIASHLYSDANEINPVLSRVFQTMRAADALRGVDSRQGLPKNFYASDDQLLRRIDLPEFKQLIEFFADSIQKTVGAVNAAAIANFKLAFGIWAWLDEQIPEELAAARRTLFEGVGNVIHHYAESRDVADRVPESTLRLAPDEVVRRMPGDWRALTGS
jgi:hypothetical protein